jgi:hypothetical protein
LDDPDEPPHPTSPADDNATISTDIMSLEVFITFSHKCIKRTFFTIAKTSHDVNAQKKHFKDHLLVKSGMMFTSVILKCALL